MLFGHAVRRILAWSEPVDMRKQFDGFTALVAHTLLEDPLSGTLYVFVNRRGTHLKLLYWDRTGFCLFAKRLERGRFALPGEGEKRELTLGAFLLLLDGMFIDRRRRFG